MDDGRRSFTHHLMKKIHRHQSLHIGETFYEGIQGDGTEAVPRIKPQKAWPHVTASVSR